MIAALAWLAALSLVPAVWGALAAAAQRRGPERILILGRTPLADRLIGELASRPSARRVFLGIVEDVPAALPPWRGFPIFGPFSRLPEIIAALRPHRVVVALTERRRRTPVQALLAACVPAGIIVEDAADFYERLTGKLDVESLRPASLLFSRTFRRSRVQQGVARCISLPVATVALLVLAPLLALIAIAVKLDSPGPVMAMQPRIGANGRLFNLSTFRTTRARRRKRGGWAVPNSGPSTRVGRWLQALHVDTLPQLLNVLRGDMNLVGPRPHPAAGLDLLRVVARNLNELTGMAIGYYEMRSLVRPGSTGWAQVRYGAAHSLEEQLEMLRFDLYYVKHASTWLDLRILLETVRAMVRGRVLVGVPRRRAEIVRTPAGRGAARTSTRTRPLSPRLRQRGARDAFFDATVKLG